MTRVMNRLKHVASPPLAPTGMREDRFIGHDGAIWPLARDRMKNVNVIRKRMAEDVAGLIRDQGSDFSVGHEDLTRLGWTRGQVLAHGDHAIRQVVAEG